MTSDASVVSVAPCFMRSLVPAARGSSGEPGTANTSRPCSAAIRAVISDPERCAAERHARYQPIAPWKIAGARHMAERHFGNRSPAGLDDGCQQILVLGRIDTVMTARQHRHGAALEAG